MRGVELQFGTAEFEVVTYPGKSWKVKLWRSRIGDLSEPWRWQVDPVLREAPTDSGEAGTYELALQQALRFCKKASR